jgi:RNA polymerase sigma-70 factor (ECF subfamily)
MDPGKKTSLSLLERARGDDQDAWNRLLGLYSPLVQHWCQSCGVRGADAEDVCQEVFRSVAAGLPAFHSDRQGDTFRGWLRGITRHKILDHYRRCEHQPQGQGGTDAQLRILQVPEQELLAEESDEETTTLYHRALELVRGEFEARTWEAFWRAAVEGHSPNLIAADLGVTPAAVRKAKSRVLLRLRQEVGDLIN